jgi:prophage antirepressor-like protein
MEIITESNCIIKAFNNCNIQIIKELPNKYLFCGNDLAKVLDITSIRSSVQNFTNKEKVVRETYTPGGTQNVIYLTSKGVYRLLYASKKQIAVDFRDWVGDILDDLIFNDGIKLKIQLDEKIKELENLQDSHELDLKLKQEDVFIKFFCNKKICYITIFCINGIWYIKFGHTKEIQVRLPAHKREIHGQLYLVFCIETLDEYKLESEFKKDKNVIKNRVKIPSLKEDEYKTEIIAIKDEDDYDYYVTLLKKLNKDIIFDKEIMLKQLDLEIAKEQKVDKEFEMKKMELETIKLKVEMKKLELNNSYTTHTDIKLEETYNHDEDDTDIKLEETYQENDEEEDEDNKDIFKCTFCQYQTTFQKRFENHKSSHRFCTFSGCSYTNYNNPGNFNRHVQTHSEIPLFLCNYKNCDYKTKTDSNLKRHELKHADANTKCPHCEYTNLYQTILNNHIKTHLFCPFYNCDYKTTNKTRYDTHRNMHLEIKPFNCEICKKSFSQKPVLENHKRIHFGIKPYRCDFLNCEKKFTDLSGFKRHKRIHTGEHPYSCTYSDPSAFLRHKQTHDKVL